VIVRSDISTKPIRRQSFSIFLNSSKRSRVSGVGLYFWETDLRLAQTTNSPPDILQLFLPPAELTELIIAKNKNLNP